MNQKTSQSYINTNSAFVTEHGKLEKTAAENMSAEKLASRKRKQSDDFLEDAASLEHVFESKDIDWEEDAGGRGEGSSQCIKKLKKLETEGGGLKESNLKDTKARRLLVRAFFKLLCFRVGSFKLQQNKLCIDSSPHFRC